MPAKSGIMPKYFWHSWFSDMKVAMPKFFWLLCQTLQAFRWVFYIIKNTVKDVFDIIKLWIFQIPTLHAWSKSWIPGLKSSSIFKQKKFTISICFINPTTLAHQNNFIGYPKIHDPKWNHLLINFKEHWRFFWIWS